MKTYLVKNIFGPTIQGEGSQSGTAVKFLRFAGCNRWTGLAKDKEKAACWFCDTDFTGGIKMTVQDILVALQKLGPVKTVVISGGEPTLQIDKNLLSSLVDHGFKLHLETNGSKDISEIEGYFEHITCSPKQTLETTKIQWAHDLKLLYPPAIPGVTPENFESFKCKTKYLQPVWNEFINEHSKEVVDYVVKNPDWKISVQTHKLLGVE